MQEIIFNTVLVLYLVFNLIVTMTHSPKQMKKRFIDRQCFSTVVLVNAFFAPAWITKGLRFLVKSIVA